MIHRNSAVNTLNNDFSNLATNNTCVNPLTGKKNNKQTS